jgi:membrane-associated phospholipid phosphatase
MPEWITQFDTSLFFFLNRELQNSFFDLIMPFITNRTSLVVLPFLAIFLAKEKKRAVVIFGVSLFSILLGDGLSNVLKHAVERQRPCNVLENVHLIVGCTKSFSMPSNHAANAFAFAAPFLVMTRNRLKYLFLLFAVLVSLSRVFVGVHYPGDVVAGALAGTVSAAAVVALYGWAERRYPYRPYTTVMWVFLIALSCFRLYYLSFGPLDLGPDEAHYWEWSRRLDLSYYSKGPMIAYLIALSTSLFGDSVFGVRFFAVLLSFLGSIVLYRLGREMYDERTGAVSALLFQIIPIFSVFGVIFTIDSPFTFFWILSLYLFWKATDNHPYSPLILRGGERRVKKYDEGGGTSLSERSATRGGLLYWVFLGISTGLGLLTKYTMVFFHVCALFFLISSGRHRRLLRTAAPHVALLISVILFLPVIVWNAQHDWVTVRHTAGQAHIADGMRISIKSFVEFTGSQLGVVTPVIFVLMMHALWKMRSPLKPPAAPAAREGRGIEGKFLFWFSVPVVAFFLVKSLQGKVQPNWAMTGYITGIIAFSEFFLDSWKGKKNALKAFIVSGMALSLLVTAVAHYPSKFHLPPKLDPSSKLRGWSDLGRQVGEFHEEMQKRGDVFIFSDSYQTASELAFYIKGHPVTYCISLGRRMNQYDLWPGFHKLIHYNGIFVTIGDVGLDPRIRDAFQICEKRSAKVHQKERVLREFTVFLCRDFKGIGEEPIGRY